MKKMILILCLALSHYAQAENRNYEVSQGRTVNLDLLQESLLGELQMLCNDQLERSSTCQISSFKISGIRPFYNIANRSPAQAQPTGLHIIDLSLNSQLVRCNVEFVNESKTIDLKECESVSLKAKIFEQIINVDFRLAGVSG